MILLTFKVFFFSRSMRFQALSDVSISSPSGILMIIVIRSLAGRVLLGDLEKSYFSLLIPSRYIIGVFNASDSNTWKIAAYLGKEYCSVGKNWNRGALYKFSGPGVGLKYAYDGICGNGGAITVQATSFLPGNYYQVLMDRTWDSVVHSSSRGMKNMASPSNTPPQIPTADISKTLMQNKGPSSSSNFLFIVSNKLTFVPSKRIPDLMTIQTPTMNPPLIVIDTALLNYISTAPLPPHHPPLTYKPQNWTYLRIYHPLEPNATRI